MRFEALWCWYFVPPLLVYLWWLSRRSYAQLNPLARWVGLGLRTLVMILLIAALSRPSFFKLTDQHHLIFVLDVSKSITPENRDAALREMERLANDASESGKKTLYSLIAFGERAELLLRSQRAWSEFSDPQRQKINFERSLIGLYVERTDLISAGNGGDRSQELQDLEERIAAIEEFRDKLAGDHTDIEQAVRLALNCGSADDLRTIYVLTDGNFNRGQWRRSWNAADDGAAKLHTIVLDRALPAEVAVTDVVLPQKVLINQGFSAQVHIASTVATAAQLAVFKDGFVVEQRDVQLKVGENTFKVSGLYFREKGFHPVEAVIRAQRDTQVRNNTMRSLVVVPGEARVLYVDADEDQMPYLQGALELEGLQVEARPASGVPETLSGLLSFDAFILSNVPADRLTLRQMRMIRSYVQDFGGGFVMLGGDESFGLGGYYNTPIEEILPVRMPIQKDMLRPSLGIMLVIDKSGSMSGVKIQLAKRAAIATSEAINPRDQIGVIGFDGQSRVILELTSAADRATIASHIAALDAGGGTFMYPALEEAHQRLIESNARRKHVIVLSDGQTQGFGYEELVGAMAADGVTLSAVGIGDGADMQLLETIAMAGGGRAYFTNDFYSIPQIFTREALRASKSMLIERLVRPIAIGDDVALNEIDTDELPLLTGYVATTPKPAADMIIVSDSGDPLLAKWRYGLGRTVAFTSETKPRWAEDWLDWPDFAKFWSQLVRSVTGQELALEISVECHHAREGAGVILTADVRDTSGGFVTDLDIELSTLDRNGQVLSLPVERSGPGLFSSRLATIRYGDDQQFAWRVHSDEQPSEGQAISYGFVYPFSPEFRTLGVADEVLEQIAARGLGQVMRVGDSRLILGDSRGTRWVPLWPYLLAIALLVIPLDIACRRLGG